MRAGPPVLPTFGMELAAGVALGEGVDQLFREGALAEADRPVDRDDGHGVVGLRRDPVQVLLAVRPRRRELEGRVVVAVLRPGHRPKRSTIRCSPTALSRWVCWTATRASGAIRTCSAPGVRHCSLVASARLSSSLENAT
ncbi:hypothetical protein [Streptomyces sp. TE33382]